MNIYNHIQSKVYANDPDYDKLSGYVTRQYQVEWTDTNGTRWRKTCTTINLGKADPVSPVDPDAQMGAESLNYDRSASLDAAYEQVRILTEQRKQRAHIALVAHLQAHGPQTIEALLGLTEWEIVATLRNYMRSQPAVFVRLYKSPAVWGLVGQTYTPALKDLKPPKGAWIIRDVLVERGPMTQREIQAATGLSRSFVQACVAEWPVLFCVVGRKRVPGATMPSVVVGVKGIHEPKEGEL